MSSGNTEKSRLKREGVKKTKMQGKKKKDRRGLFLENAISLEGEGTSHFKEGGLCSSKRELLRRIGWSERETKGQNSICLCFI